MKSASEWLASSDEDEHSQTTKRKTTPTRPIGVRRKSRTPSPTTQSLSIPESESPTFTRSRDASAPFSAAVARQREAEERRRKQEELRERMKSTLGQGAVDAVVEAVAKKETVRPLAASDDSTNSSGAFASGLPSTHQLPPVVPSTRSSVDGKRRQGIPEHLEEVDVLVADRGTQTVMNSECQTDPEPRVLHCEECYATYYGHYPADAYCPHEANLEERGTITGGGSSDPVFAALMQRHSRRGGGRATGPWHQPARDAGPLAGAVATTAMLRDQLHSVQTTIDLLITRYNLPPPPSLEHLAVQRPVFDKVLH